MASPFLSQALLSVTIIMSCNLTWWLFCSRTPLVCMPSCCTKTLCCGEVELHMLFREPGSDTGLSLVYISTTMESIIVRVFRSFQNLFEVGTWTLWMVLPSLQCFQSRYFLVASEAGWQHRLLSEALWCSCCFVDQEFQCIKHDVDEELKMFLGRVLKPCIGLLVTWLCGLPYWFCH